MPVVRTLLIAFFLITNICQAESLPNILLLISDDQRFDQSAYMPNVLKKIGAKGITYQKAYITTPLCCPSRAAIYTGKYNSRNKVIGNNYPLSMRTIFQDLDEKYYQGIIGKYLNSHDGTPKPEFDFWAVFPYGRAKFRNPLFNINGEEQRLRGALDSRIAKLAKGFIHDSAQQEKPWFLTCAFFSPHAPAVADPRDRGRFAAEKFHPRPNYKKVSPNKPAYVNHSSFDAEATKKLAARQKDSIYSMDRAIGSIIELLEKNQSINNTMIIFLSDNGIFQGEHNLNSKVAPYEEAIKVPFFLRYDPLIPNKKEYNSLVSNIDIPATIYDLTGITPADQLDGKSLRPTFNSEDPIRTRLLIEGWKNNWKERESFYALHTGNEILINNDQDLSEYYDLTTDPYQLNNQHQNPVKVEQIDLLQQELNSIVIDTRGALDFDLPAAEKIKIPKNVKR